MYLKVLKVLNSCNSGV